MTNAPHRPEDPPLLTGHEPAELLAASCLGLSRGIEQSLVVLAETPGADAWSISAMDLADLLRTDGRERLEELLGMVADLRPHCAKALIVLEDGYLGVSREECAETAELLAPWILAAALQLLPEQLALQEVWTLGAGRGILTVLRGSDRCGMDLAVSDPMALAPLEETAIAADAVLRGVPWPRRRLLEQNRLADALEEWDPVRIVAQHSPASDAAGDTSPAAVIAAGRHGISRLLAAGAGSAPDSGRSMNECERLIPVLSALHEEASAAGLLRHLCRIDEPGTATICGVLDRLREDTTLRPRPDVMPGGELFDRYEDLFIALTMAGWGEGCDERGASWRHLGALLFVLAWWARRERIAGSMLDALVVAERMDPLARCLAARITGGDVPAWALGPAGGAEAA